MGKGRVRVNPSPRFVGDRGCAKDLHARRPKGLGGFSYFSRMAISRTDFLSFINAMCMRNRTMGIPALEDGLFVNLLIFDYLYIEIGGAGHRNVARES